MAHGLIQVSGFPIESYHSVFNRNFKRSLKENQSDGQKEYQENICTNRYPSIFALRRLFASQSLRYPHDNSTHEPQRRTSSTHLGLSHEFWSLPLTFTREDLGTYTSASNLPGSNYQGLVRNYLINISNKGIKQTTR